jgi:DUF1680 family protein
LKLRGCAVLAASLLAGCAGDDAPAGSGSAAIESFALADVRLQDGSPFKSAEQNNLRYVLAMDPDRLLAPYLREAGLEPKADSYGNWENTGLDGHIGGHYLSALSLAWAATGNEEARTRLQYMLDELERAQQANGDGYLGGVPGGKAAWDEIRRGTIDAELFSLNDKWVPWYNLHKSFSGLRDAYVHTGSEQAKRMLVALTEWAVGLVAGLSDKQIQVMLITEHGGLNEVFADVAAMTGDPRYLELAQRFSHRLVLDPLLQQEDRLDGLHANTQIPKVIGYKRVSQLTGDDRWADAADRFWHNVVYQRSVAIGGNSVREHFHPVDDFSEMTSDVEGPETCNTYNMLKLSKLLYGDSGDLEYIEYYERALYNHILSSQHPDDGGLVYFTPMRPAHYRKYSRPGVAMWCCIGSGMENHFKYGELIYARRGADLFVNLFIPSRLAPAGSELRLVQATAFPDGEKTLITLEKGGGEFALNLRYPAWVAEGALSVTVNGEKVEMSAKPGEYVGIERRWRAGDEVAVTLPMTTRLEPLPDGSDWYAVLHGPVVLAAKTPIFENEALEFRADDSRMGHKADGPLCPPDATPMMVAAPDEFLATVEPVNGKSLTFRAKGLDVGGAGSVELVPFFRLHDSRYTLYWPRAAGAGSEASVR